MKHSEREKMIESTKFLEEYTCVHSKLSEILHEHSWNVVKEAMKNQLLMMGNVEKDHELTLKESKE